MKKKRELFSFLAVVLFFLSLSAAGRALAVPQADEGQAPLMESKSNIPEDYNCINCHRDMADDYLTPPINDWMESVHRQVGVMCADCHGGDPKDEEMAMDPERGFIGVPAPENIPELCARCHADAKLMRVYNQRSDQYSLYSGSVHGRKLADGDTEAASCVSCHGKHKILRAKDPNSKVARKNIPETCGGCHSKKDVFEKRRKPYDQLELYKKSRHHELFAKGDLLVPTCVDCHGNHGVISPRSERTQTVCFNCHAQQAEYYKASAHWTAYRKNGEPICLSCHGNHDVMRPGVEKFTGGEDRDCIGCHAEDSKAYKTGMELKQTMTATLSAVTKARESLEGMEKDAHGGFEISDLKDRTEKTSSKLKELHTLTHKLNADELKKQSDAVISVAQYVSGTVDEMWAEIRTRKIGLVGAWAIFIGFVGFLTLKARSLERRED